MIALLVKNWKLVVIAVLLALLGVQQMRVSAGKTDLATYRTQVAQEREAMTRAALAEQQANARETLRRLERQQENQRAQDLELAAARRAAATNAAAADRLREQNAAAARQWRDALSNSPSVEQCQAAGDAIGVLADVLGRADRRAGVLATYADAARAAGLKCERDYDALTEGQKK